MSVQHCCKGKFEGIRARGAELANTGAFNVYYECLSKIMYNAAARAFRSLCRTPATSDLLPAAPPRLDALERWGQCPRLTQCGSWALHLDGL